MTNTHTNPNGYYGTLAERVAAYESMVPEALEFGLYTVLVDLGFPPALAERLAAGQQLTGLAHLGSL